MFIKDKQCQSDVKELLMKCVTDLKLSSFCQISVTVYKVTQIVKLLYLKISFEEKIEHDLVNTASAYTI